GERLTALKVGLAVVVMVGATLTVRGTTHQPFIGDAALPSVMIGVIGGVLAAVSYAGTTILARWAVPQYGTLRVLFWELAGGTAILGVVLTLAGHAPAPATTTGGWMYLLALAAGPVLGANFLFFAAVKRIQAAWAAVAATIEPVAGAFLALLLFGQVLTPLGWMGLALVVGGVGVGYWREGRGDREG
ncbi:MAG: DMT family transporter, partial [Gemmatimonadales bacterium]